MINVRIGRMGGETSMDNLVLLCRRHHRLVHEEGFGVQAERIVLDNVARCEALNQESQMAQMHE